MSVSQKFRRMKRSVRIGTYSFVMGAVLLAVILMVNLLVGALPNRFTKLEIAMDSTTRISDKTVDFVRSLEEDITVYWLCEDGEADGQLEIFLSRYTEQNPHVKVEIIDPLTDPYFTATYTQETLPNYSFIVVSDKRFCVVSSTDLTEYELDVWSQLNGKQVMLSYAELESIYTQYGAYLQDATAYAYFRGESELNAALEYVTVENIPHGYLLTGHGDKSIPDGLSEMMENTGVTLESVNLQNLEAVPADADCLVLYAPSTDISAQELAMIRAFLDQGGSLLLITDPQIIGKCPNVAALGQSFGLSAQAGMVADSDPTYTAGNSVYTLVPKANSNQPISYMLSGYGYSARMPYAHSIAVASSLPAGVTAQPLLTTSTSARRMDGSTPISDPAALYVAVAADKTVTKEDGSTKTGHMIWYGSTEAFTDEVAQATSMGNYVYFLFSVRYMSEAFTSNFAVDSIDMNGYVMSDLTTMSSLVWIGITVVVIPIALLVSGIVIWARRRKR